MIRVIIATALLLTSPPVINGAPEPEPVFWEVWDSQEPWEWWQLEEEEPEELPQEEHVPAER